VTQDGPSSPHSQDPEGRYDLGASVNQDAECLFEPNDNPVGFFGFSHDNTGFTDPGVGLQSLPLWDPINLYGESEFAYDADLESGEEDTQ